MTTEQEKSEFVKALIEEADSKETPAEFVQALVEGGVAMMIAAAPEDLSRSELAAGVCRTFSDLSLYAADCILTGGKGNAAGIDVHLKIELPGDYDDPPEAQH